MAVNRLKSGENRNEKIQSAIREHRSFKAGALTGTRRADGSYVVKSYDAVLYKVDKSGKVIQKNLGRRYSATTSQHQAHVSRAVEWNR